MPVPAALVLTSWERTPDNKCISLPRLQVQQDFQQATVNSPRDRYSVWSTIKAARAQHKFKLLGNVNLRGTHYVKCTPEQQRAAALQGEAQDAADPARAEPAGADAHGPLLAADAAAAQDAAYEAADEEEEEWLQEQGLAYRRNMPRGEYHTAVVV